MLKLLVVEDNPDIARFLAHKLQSDYSLDLAANAQEAFILLKLNTYDGFIIDLGLPDCYGLKLVQRLREKNYSQPILILSAFQSKFEIVQTLEAGANDYLTKPFALSELKARLRVLTRSNQTKEQKTQIIKFGKFQFNFTQLTASYQGKSVKFNKKEAQILKVLLENQDETVERQALLKTVWQKTQLNSNTLSVYINRLRKKLQQHLGLKVIETVRGVGYVINST